MNERLDQENLDALLKHIEWVGYGKTTITITAHNGLIASWEEVETRRGRKAPLRLNSKKT